MANCVWIKPGHVAAFEFLEWTNADHVRHIKFIALREDKDPRTVVRELGLARDDALREPPPHRARYCYHAATQ
jgi:ATP-dependent DNA ligase